MTYLKNIFIFARTFIQIHVHNPCIIDIDRDMKTISFRFKYEDKKLQDVLLEDSRICSAMRKRMFPTEFCIKTEVDTGSRKPMEGRTRIRLSILERAIWRN